MKRRAVIKVLSGLGIGSALFHKAIAGMVSLQEDQEITTEMIQQAEWIADLELTNEQREKLTRQLNRAQRSHRAVLKIKLQNSTAPAFVFKPLVKSESDRRHIDRNIFPIESQPPAKPQTDEDLAFLPVFELAALVRHRTVTSQDLTKLYLERLKKYDRLLKCVVNYTEELAMEQAKRADREIAAGLYKGPLHGIPWGAKDLVAIPGYPTTWGAPQFKEQQLDEKATVATRLERAGAVLIAKLSLGALAMGDKWFGGMTRNPWDPKSGSSGSSAGSASSVVAGLAGFTLGSETLGSIISPSKVCGASSLRPTFGRVSRYGCMQLSWTMDKIGPICRSIQDCALVFGAIHGGDDLDLSAGSYPYHWPGTRELSTYKVGYVAGGKKMEERDELRLLKKLGVELVEVELPKEFSAWDLATVLDVEAAATFTELTRASESEGLNSWPGIFRAAEFVTGVQYFKAMQARTRLMHRFEEVMQTIDVLVNANDLVITNLTGHPSTVMPAGFRERKGVERPYSTIFTGQLNGETDLLTLSYAYQQLLDAHLKRPSLDEALRKFDAEEPDDPDESKL